MMNQSALDEIQKVIEQHPLALEPAYNFNGNEPTLLYEGMVEFAIGNATHSVEGKIEWRWLPSPCIYFSIVVSDESTFDAIELEDKILNIKVPNSVANVEFMIINRRINSGRSGVELSIEAICFESIDFEHQMHLRYVLFHLPNFNPIISGSHRFANNLRSGRLQVEVRGWRITIDNSENCSDTVKSLKDQGGRAFTHVVKVEKADASLFSIEEAKDLQNSLFWFLSFSRGLACSLFLPVGYDDVDKVVWRQWQASRMDSWRNSRSWFSDRNFVNESFQSALDGFLSRWKETVWEDPKSNNTPLRYAIHWYLAANNDAGGIEGCIILAQTALELLSWVILVEDPITKKFGRKFDQKHADEKFKELLQYIGVADSIPSEFTELCALASNKGWSSGPQALAGFRNTIVHPKRRMQNSGVVFKERYQILELALWYIELTLLHLYQGAYMNRTSANEYAGVTEIVPWSNSSTP